MSTPGRYLIFPEHTIEGSAGSGMSDIVIEETDGAEFRLRLGRARRRRITIGGVRMTGLQHEEFQTFCDLVEDEYQPFLIRDVRRCKLVNELIGVGDGVTKTFQLQMTRELQGQTKTTPVKYPDHDYPPRFWPTAPNSPVRQYWPRAGDNGLVKIFVNDAPVAIDTSTAPLLDDLRYKGLVTLVNAPAAASMVRASCYFYHLMRFNAGSPQTRPRGGGVWEVEGGIELIEPRGGK
jgi:hypothetical protein